MDGDGADRSGVARRRVRAQSRHARHRRVDGKGPEIVAASGTNATDPSWLPAAERAIGTGYEVAAAPSRKGANFDYAIQPVLGSDLYILSRFDSSARRTAWLRTLALVLTPLIMLATHYFAYSRAIQSELLRWIDGIETAVWARRVGGAPLAPENDEMPSELRDLAASFNEMTRELEIREQSLKTSLAENEFLIRELHHRVKTSLQIIQSYLSLTRRLDGSSAEHGSVAAMEARVQVLSIAYRKAFSAGRMRDVRIRQFVTEIVDNLSLSLERPGLTLDLKADVSAALVIDRAIPLGLALVESVMAGLGAQDAHLVSVRIGELDDLRVDLRVETDGALAPDRPNAKLMAAWACSSKRVPRAWIWERSFDGGFKAGHRPSSCRITRTRHVHWLGLGVRACPQFCSSRSR